MRKYLFKIKNFSLKNTQDQSGFVILFAVTLAAILLSITLGVANVAYKELRFGTSARDTNDAFFAADTGIECALINDKTTGTSFLLSGSSGKVSCFGGDITLGGSAPEWNFVVTGLGSNGQGCSYVTVTKDAVSQDPYIVTTLNAKGYNIYTPGLPACGSTSANRIEREIKLTY